MALGVRPKQIPKNKKSRVGAHKLPKELTMPNPNFKRLIHKNLLYMIEASVGSEIFKHIYVVDIRDGREFDALDDGSGACAFTVSGIIALQGLIDHPHATVATTIERLRQAGWTETTDPQPGDVVQWAAHNDHMHMAFYMGEDRVVGNSTKNQVVAEYGLTLDDGRTPIAYFTHPSLREG
jgi:hypothetical protein